jgi:hypothetical protein
MFAAEFPSAEISNGLITAELYLPDPEKGYYRGTRFDWSGNMYSLKTKDHEYFGQWFEKYDPKLHDAIMGPVEEFKTNNARLGLRRGQGGRDVHSHRGGRGAEAGRAGVCRTSRRTRSLIRASGT